MAMSQKDYIQTNWSTWLVKVDIAHGQDFPIYTDI